MHKLLMQAIEAASTLPDDQQEAVASRLLEEVQRRRRSRNKWSVVAERLAELDLLQGRSAELERHVREFRDGFAFREPPGA
jgi:hypothetical protein